MQKSLGRYLTLVPLAIPVLAACAGTAIPRASAPGCTTASGYTRAGVYFECHGRGNDVVVLVPAFSMDTRMWDREVALLAPRARVITLDLRGHGRSRAPLEPYSAPDDLLALMDELRLPSAQLVGLSNGARIALDFALEHPGRVRSLVLASPGVSGYTGGDFSYMAPVFEAVRAKDWDAAAARWAATPLMRVRDSSAAALVRQVTHDNRMIWSAPRNPERPLDPPAIGRLERVQAPVLVVSGAEDLPDLRRLADTVSRRIPRARHVVIPGAGHLVNLAAPRAFDALLLEFLRH